MPSYLDIVYNENTRPYTKYPSQLGEYLFSRFRMEKGDKLLDVGCGRGDFAKGFKDAGLEVFGLDREKGNSEILKGIEVKTGDIKNDPFPFEGETFDFVFSKSVIEHLLEPDNFMKECRRVLKPGGRIIIMAPDWHSQRYIFYDDYTHRHPYTAAGLKDLLNIYGFKEVGVEIFYQLPILWKYPWLKIFSRILQLSGPIKKIHKNKFIRWSKELMILGVGIK
ncbi:MAG: class I SAM-dependent methyltransferase [Candidatus Azambacteria bacterium]|nr:class I SAM-dependent methyltransferase [Candidatus Azambacteria bacterium]